MIIIMDNHSNNNINIIKDNIIMAIQIIIEIIIIIIIEESINIQNKDIFKIIKNHIENKMVIQEMGNFLKEEVKVMMAT